MSLRPSSPSIVASLVATFVVLVGCSGPPDYRWDQSSQQLIPDQVGPSDVDPSRPEVRTTLLQLTDLAPDVAGHAGSVVEPGADRVSIFVLEGPLNSLNSVQLQVARSLGAGRQQDSWQSEDVGANGSRREYHKREEELGDVKIDVLSARSIDGTVIEQWWMLRPRDELLVMSRNVSGDADQSRSAIESLLERAEQR